MGTCNFLVLGLYIVFDINENNSGAMKRITLKKRWRGMMSRRKGVGMGHRAKVDDLEFGPRQQHGLPYLLLKRSGKIYGVICLWVGGFAIIVIM